jgi:four helix bundle protein
VSESQDGKRYDLEDRTLEFAKRARAFVRALPKTLANIEDAKQLVRASGSVGANYIEANDGLSKKDLLMRIRICRKESKECRFWLKLLDMQGSPDAEMERGTLVREATELMNIFGAIMRKIDGPS